jgi:hypothetical protein
MLAISDSVNRKSGDRKEYSLLCQEGGFKGLPPVTVELALSANALYPLPATALPLPETLGEEPKADDALLARQLSELGCPGFAHLRPGG